MCFFTNDVVKKKDELLVFKVLLHFYIKTTFKLTSHRILYFSMNKAMNPGLRSERLLDNFWVVGLFLYVKPQN